MRGLIALVTLCLLPAGAGAEQGSALPPGTQVGWVGEIHDNPAHHKFQAQVVAATQPTALVFEMLTADQAARPGPADRRDADRLGQVLAWDDSGWPDWALYAPIFLAAPEAQLYGAARDIAQVRYAVSDGAAVVFGGAAPLFGLDQALPADQQTAREAIQQTAHCDAMPPEMLPGMVEAQRLRDADLAYAALRALAETGGPVIVIAGNGHVRGDWGAPALLSQADPGIRQHIIVLGEDEAAPATLSADQLVTLPAPSGRADPCAAFRQ